MYTLVYAARDGRHVVENERGERFRQTPESDWTAELAAWRADLDRLQPLREKLLRRAEQHAGFTEWYRRARAAIERETRPCPMPWGHVMFKGISRPQTIADVIRRALSHGDAKAAAAAADALRAKGFTYRETFETVARVVPNATLAQWDALLREADEGWA